MMVFDELTFNLLKQKLIFIF